MKRIITALVLTGVAVTGCGGSSANKDVAVQQSASASPTSEPLPTIPSVSAECLKAAQAYRSSSNAFSGGAGTDLATTFGAVAEQLRAYKDNAPSGEVRDAFATLAEIYGNLATKLKGVNYVPKPGSPPPAAYLSALQEIGSPKFAAAAKTLGTYFGTACKG